MKKLIAFISASILALTMLVSCGGAAKSNATAEEVYTAINAAFTEQYGHEAIANMPMEIDEVTLTEKFHIDPAQVESYKGVIAGMMTNCDMLLVVKANDGEIENVTASLEQALQEQKDAFSWYAVMANPERLDASKVVVNGNFAAILCVGVVPEDGNTEGIDFTADVAMAEEAFAEAVK